MESALARAYAANPQLNAQRASVRAVDENVNQALSGYRPKIAASADAGYTVQDVLAQGATSNSKSFPRGIGVQVNQTVFNGGRTGNNVRRADAGVLAAREQLRSTEQSVLLDAATAYMDVLRDTAILNLRNNNIDVLEEQLRQTRDRFNVGEVTRTDVAQAEARLAASRSDSSTAAGALKASLARFRQVIGVDARQLAPAKPMEANLPRSLDEAVALGLGGHPAVLAALHGVDAAALLVKVTEGELAPSLTLQGTVSHRWDYQSPNNELNTASVAGTLSVPLYEGGEVYSRVRQAKETLGQRRIEADQARDSVRQAVVSSWANLEATKERINSSQAQIQAAEVALNGVREEAKVGQRTTLDVLNAQQELLSARVNLITAQRDRVVASYNLQSALGRLSSTRLRLATQEYKPTVHYEQVRDKWIGLRNPDGR
ncbi:channel protein TolC [Alsobacter metallidurans]|uniref:Channel protein TolC n=1 Tax=Alsobacter metallidurans TaxID=340221 RepID=A0A917I7L6_9HYPH|nr:TolC family outer membrane protein [Alsobacter metallidurans]GGH22579.1 channel protein TolC [Alsobacter metallidurans]